MIRSPARNRNCTTRHESCWMTLSDRILNSNLGITIKRLLLRYEYSDNETLSAPSHSLNPLSSPALRTIPSIYHATGFSSLHSRLPNSLYPSQFTPFYPSQIRHLATLQSSPRASPSARHCHQHRSPRLVHLFPPSQRAGCRMGAPTLSPSTQSQVRGSPLNGPRESHPPF